MGRELGRISGPLLADNLLRNGANLAFDTDVMYLDVNNKFVGFNTDTPTRSLDVLGDIYSKNLNVGIQAEVSHIIFGGLGTLNQISNLRNEPIIISPAQSTDPVVQFNGIGVTDKFNIIGSTVTGFTNQNIIFDPTGKLIVGANTTFTLLVPNEPLLATTTANNYFRTTVASSTGLDIGSELTNLAQFAKGTTVTDIQGPFNDYGWDYYIIFTSSNQIVDLTPGTAVSATISKTNIFVDGNIQATGSITFGGDITFGNEATDVITFAANVGSNIIPSANGVWSLGENSTPLIWNNIYSTNLNTTTFNATSAEIGTLNAGNIKINGSTINNLISTNDVNLVPSGSGSLNFNSFLSIKDSTITHYDSVPLQFVATGNGYFKFGGETGLVIPLGGTSARPVDPEIGTIRYNTDTITPEVYANVSDTTTITDTLTSADVNIGDTTIFVDSTTNFKVGDFVSSTTVPGTFVNPTLITSISVGVSITIDVPATEFLPSGSNLRVQRKWIPVIGTSPVLAIPEVEEIMDIWTLILG